MAKNIFILEGGYFWKQLPAVVMPAEVDLFGNPVGESKRTCTRHHGLFVGKKREGDHYKILLKLIGRVVIWDDVLHTNETTDLQSEILLLVPKHLHDYDFVPGMPYIITTTEVIAL